MMALGTNASSLITTPEDMFQGEHIKDSIDSRQPKFSLCGNLSCQSCSANGNVDFFGSEKLLALQNHHRICSSNESIALDDSSCEVGYSSPNSFNHNHRQRARSLSCSPSKSHNDSDIIILHNEKFKEKYPNACMQMEENLQSFIESNKDLNQFEQKQLDPAARFIQSQIIELAKLCLGNE
jgi:hypothetical protein